MLISERIEVEMAETELAMKVPAAFVWDGTRYEIERILDFNFDIGFGAQKRGRAWYNRRHRNCYRVEASDGHVYDIYLDRSSHQRKWVLYQRVEGE
ncbi:MAG: hypothetical protein GX131_07355 [candidate division WS1 bacterium]|jgi:hypothetical protein|nr:hypothetical protein [candidate division WS1 bacterium]